jgi:threonine synthase
MIEPAGRHRFVCRRCGNESIPDAVQWRCTCGGPFDLLTDRSTFPRHAIDRRPPTMWRYREAMPFAPDDPVIGTISMGEGMTPLVAHPPDAGGLLLKLEFLSPTLSFKDRGAAVLVAKALELGATELVADSSGNAGTAISAYAARAGLPCTVFVPGGTSAKKLAQMQAHGAAVVEVAGTREDTAAAAIASVEERRAFYASHVYSPWFYEGTKTYGFEVCEQLGWSSPDLLVLPVGNGTLVLGVARAFDELLAGGVIDRLPRLLLVQASACAPIARAFRADTDRVEPVRNEGTIAEGIAIAAPARGERILEVVRRYGGDVVAVGDDEIRESVAALARRGLYVEPTAAAPLAGVMRNLEESRAPRGDRVVVPLSGAGLKTAA